MNDQPPLPATDDPAARIETWIRRHGATIRRTLPWLQIATGILLLVIGWSIGKTPIALLSTGESTTGEIVRFEHQSSRSFTQASYSAFHPVVEITVDGRRMQFRDRWGSSSAAGVHEAVPVLFDPRAPALALVDRPLLNWMPWAPIVLVGVLLVLAGVVGIRRGDGAR